MLKIYIGLSLGFIIGWIARVAIFENTPNDLNMDEIAQQMREDFHGEVKPHVHAESDGDRPQTPIDG